MPSCDTLQRSGWAAVSKHVSCLLRRLKQKANRPECVHLAAKSQTKTWQPYGIASLKFLISVRLYSAVIKFSEYVRLGTSRVEKGGKKILF